MSERYRIQIRIGLTVMAGLLVMAATLWRCFSEMSVAEVAAHVGNNPRDSELWFEETFSPARSELLGEQVIGYVAKNAPEQFGNDDRTNFEWIRYALAPTVVEPSSQHHILVAYFHDDEQLQTYMSQHGLLLKLHLAAGCALLERSKP